MSHYQILLEIELLEYKMNKFNFTENTGNLKETEEKFLKPKSKEETLKDAIEFLDTAKFNFACFVDAFKRYLIKSGLLKKE